MYHAGQRVLILRGQWKNKYGTVVKDERPKYPHVLLRVEPFQQPHPWHVDDVRLVEDEETTHA